MLRSPPSVPFDVILAGVVAAAVYVLCELARTNPKNYVALAPTFFQILTTSTNNWVLIKIVKLVRGGLQPGLMLVVDGLFNIIPVSVQWLPNQLRID